MKRAIIPCLAVLALVTACGRPPATPAQVESQAAERTGNVAAPAAPTEPAAPPAAAAAGGETSPVAPPVSPVAGPATEIGGVVEKSPDAQQQEKLVQKAKEMLAQIPHGGANAAAASLLKMEARTWPDSSLGCPQPGIMYAQVVTPGYLMVLEVEGVEYEFHTDAGSNAVLCLIDGQDAAGVLGQ